MKTVILIALLFLSQSAQADGWRYSTLYLDREGGPHIIYVNVNGVKVKCLFDTGANAYGAIWLQRATAAKLKLQRRGNDYHYYEGLTVSVGGYRRNNVTSYEYSEAWDPEDQCLIGDTFFKVDELLIDKKSKRLFWR